MRMEEKMEEEEMEWREKMVEMHIGHEKQMMQMQAAIPSKSQYNGEEEAHAIGERAKEIGGSSGGEQRFRATPKSIVDKSVEKFQLQTLQSLNERLLKETHEKRKKFGALVQAKEVWSLT